VRVRVNDRGPFSSKGGRPRVVDVSKAAAEQLDMIGAGVVRVELRVVPGP
jgi:rare lipoprotein A